MYLHHKDLELQEIRTCRGKVYLLHGSDRQLQRKIWYAKRRRAIDFSMGVGIHDTWSGKMGVTKIWAKHDTRNWMRQHRTSSMTLLVTRWVMYSGGTWGISGLILVIVRTLLGVSDLVGIYDVWVLRSERKINWYILVKIFKLIGWLD